jgi:hypothetical protein
MSATPNDNKLQSMRPKLIKLLAEVQASIREGGKVIAHQRQMINESMATHEGTSPAECRLQACVALHLMRIAKRDQLRRHLALWEQSSEP